MGLIINKQITLYDELVVDSIYVRVFYRYSIDGKSIHINYFTYLSKESFKANPNDNIIRYSCGLSPADDLIVKHDRLEKGTDTLKYVHDCIKESLCTDKTEEKVITNEDGSVKKDKDGEEVKEKIVVKEKFVEPENITIDLDNSKEIEEPTQDVKK